MTSSANTPARGDRGVITWLPDADRLLRVDSPEKIRGRCYWPVEVRAGGELWKRFLVTADGARVTESPSR
jgi:hypothetical protein